MEKISFQCFLKIPDVSLVEAESFVDLLIEAGLLQVLHVERKVRRLEVGVRTSRKVQPDVVSPKSGLGNECLQFRDEVGVTPRLLFAHLGRVVEHFSV